ncbi:MAG: DsbA family protein [Pseudomonadota bacterium]
MHLLRVLICACLLPWGAMAGPFDDLSDADRAALHGEIRDYLLQNPDIVVEVIEMLEAREREQTARADTLLVQQNRDALSRPDGSFVAGNPQGDITVVEFIDYQCSYCKRAHPEVADLLAGDGNIRLIQKELPILGPLSEQAARAATAVLLGQPAEVYADFSDRLMRHQGPLSAALINRYASQAGADVAAMRAAADGDAVTAHLNSNRALARALRVTGTPTFVIGDQLVRGYLQAEQMEALIAAQRAEM